MPARRLPLPRQPLQQSCSQSDGSTRLQCRYGALHFLSGMHRAAYEMRFCSQRIDGKIIWTLNPKSTSGTVSLAPI